MTSFEVKKSIMDRFIDLQSLHCLITNIVYLLRSSFYYFVIITTYFLI